MAKEMTIEEELLKVTGLKNKKGESEQEYLERLLKECQQLDDKEWGSLTEAATDWVNAASKTFNAKEDIVGFPDPEAEETGDDEAEEKEAPRGRRSRDADEDEKPKSGGKERGKKTDKDEEEEAPRRGRGDKDDKKSDAKGKKADADEEEDAPPRSRERERTRDDKKDDKKSDTKGKDKPAAKEREAKADKPKGDGVKIKIKRLILKKPTISVDAIMEKLGEGTKRSTVAAIRAEFRHTLEFLKSEEALADNDLKL